MRKAAAQFEKFFGEGVKQTLKFYYEVGSRLEAIAEDPKCRKAEDQDPISLLASYIGVSKPTLAETQRFAEAYNKTEFNKLLKRVDPATGFCLKWGHARLLASVDDKEQRAELEEQTLTNVWSPEQLSAEIQGKLGKRSKGGRPLGKPGSLAGALQQIRKLTTDWVRRNDEVWRTEDQDIITEMLNQPPDTYTEQQLQDMTALHNVLAKMSEVSNDDATATKRVVEHMAEAIAQNSPKPDGIAGSSRTGKKSKSKDKSKKPQSTRAATNKGGKGRGQSAAAKAAAAAGRR
jgi:hypothetical protein